jgi:hypothetical protein
MAWQLPGRYSRSMHFPVTRYDLAAAILSVLDRRGISSAKSSVEVLSPLDHAARLFGIILADHVKPVLAPELAIMTGWRRPPVGDMWILTESQRATLIHALRHGVEL